MSDEAKSQDVESLSGNAAAEELFAMLAKALAEQKPGAPPLDVQMKKVGGTTTFRLPGRKLRIVFESGKQVVVEREG